MSKKEDFIFWESRFLYFYGRPLSQILRDRDQFQDVPTRDNKVRRWYHMEVRNLHRQEIAHGCLVYLESLEDLSNGKKRDFELVEFKWKGLYAPAISIAPQKSRLFDGFYVYHNSPHIVHLGINDKVIDAPDFFPYYSLTGPGDFILRFIIYSENFPPTKTTLNLHIGNNLDDINFHVTERHERG